MGNLLRNLNTTDRIMLGFYLAALLYVVADWAWRMWAD